jgi:hypothetical protein
MTMGPPMVSQPIYMVPYVMRGSSPATPCRGSASDLHEGGQVIFHFPVLSFVGVPTLKRAWK